MAHVTSLFSEIIIITTAKQLLKHVHRFKKNNNNLFVMFALMRIRLVRY